MNYDTSISTEVSLSKVLDEMILDGTDLEVIVSFLESHESQIEDIYRHSAFVYDLYDLAAHPYRVNDFLTRHIEALPPSDMCFAGDSLANFLVAEDIYPEVMRELRKQLRGNADLLRFRSDGYKGRLIDDQKVASGDVDFIRLVEAISVDNRDIKTFLQESYLARSMLMATNFLDFSTRAQFLILKSVGDIIRYGGGRIYAGKHIIHALNTLLKQLLVAGETATFNWVVNVLEIHPSNGAIIERMWSDQFERIPRLLGERFGRELNTFEEVVFEMNMMETQFDVLDLFIYIYLFDSHFFKGMKANTELLEFFNLPFHWNELEKLNPEWGKGK